MTEKCAVAVAGRSMATVRPAPASMARSIRGGYVAVLSWLAIRVVYSPITGVPLPNRLLEKLIVSLLPNEPPVFVHALFGATAPIFIDTIACRNVQVLTSPGSAVELTTIVAAGASQQTLLPIRSEAADAPWRICFAIVCDKLPLFPRSMTLPLNSQARCELCHQKKCSSSLSIKTERSDPVQQSVDSPRIDC